MPRSTTKSTGAAKRSSAGHIRTKRSKKIGLPPGTLVHVGEMLTEKVRISVIEYDETSCREKDVSQISDLASVRETQTTTWINVDGLHDLTSVDYLS